MLLPEQKGFMCMMYLSANSSGPGDLLVDFCSGAMEVTKAFQHLSEHWRFVGCGKDEDCVIEALPGLLGVFTWPVDSFEIGLAEDEETWKAAAVLSAEMGGLHEQKKRILGVRWLDCNLWHHSHSRYSISSEHHLFSLILSCRRILLHRWSAVWRSCFCEVEIKELRALECWVVWVNLMPLTAGHFHFGAGLFVAPTISKCETFRANFRSLVYTNLSRQLLLMIYYGKGTMTGLISTFSRRPKYHSNMATDLRCVEHSWWIITAPFFQWAPLTFQDAGWDTQRVQRLHCCGCV